MTHPRKLTPADIEYLRLLRLLDDLSPTQTGEGTLDRPWRITGYIADLTIEAEAEIVLGMQTGDEDLILKHLDDRLFAG